MNDWGLLPEDVQGLLYQKEWGSSKKLRDRMLGQRPFPLKVSLKVPTGTQALDKIQHFHEFIRQWKQWPHENQLHWVQRQFRELGPHDVPSSITFESMQELIEFMGPEAIARSKHWEKRMTPILAFDENLYPVLVRHLMALERLDEDDASLIAQLLPQLRNGLGKGKYLRALPLMGVDTKFLEQHFSLVSDLLDAHYEGEIGRNGGFMQWLGCVDIPKAWLLVRPLCPDTQSRFNGLPLLQLTTQTLREKVLPAKNILVVENTQSGYGLPELKNAVAVFGGGGNVSWMDAKWLQEKNIAYWGDIDSWGFNFLSDARQLQPNLVALMMDKRTVETFQQRMCQESTSFEKLPTNLNAEEIELFEELNKGIYAGSRLEQERLSPDYVELALSRWLKN